MRAEEERSKTGSVTGTSNGSRALLSAQKRRQAGEESSTICHVVQQLDNKSGDMRISKYWEGGPNEEAGGTVRPECVCSGGMT